MIKVLVCGGRDFEDFSLVDKILNELRIEKEDFIVIQGGAKGADSLAWDWAYMNMLPCWRFPAKWKALGMSAGYIRNKQMLDEGKPDLVIAFPGGKGTANMVKQARERGIEVREIAYNGKET